MLEATNLLSVSRLAPMGGIEPLLPMEDNQVGAHYMVGIVAPVA